VTRATLSVVVVTLDEEERIRACLDSVAWADEIIVVDAESQDKTAAIARELTDHVIVRPWPGSPPRRTSAGPGHR
jgi:glycosyltransferase involved in cell wall biosynthesis